MSKVCTKCKVEKPVVDFYKDKRHSCGLQSHCKLCFKKQHDEYHNSKQYREWLRKYISTEEFRNRNMLAQRKTRKTDKNKAWWKKYRQTEPLKSYIIAYNKEYRKEYIKTEKGKAHRLIKSMRRRARKLSTSDGTVTKTAIDTMLLKQGHKCKLCEVCLIENKKNLDHIIPLSKGGIHSMSNVQWLCKSCNCKKSDKIL